MLDFFSKVFIVTGASSGIGKSCAEQIIEMGGKVVGVDNAEGAIDSSDYGHFQLSVTDENGICEMVQIVLDKYGHIDGLVNAAGIWGSSKPFYEMENESFQRVLEVNTAGAFLMSKHVSKAMIHRKQGKIVNISCIRASVFRENMVDYAASKGAVKCSQVIDTGETGHGALAGFLKEYGADVMICGGIGGGAIAAMAESNIKVYAGASGKADEVTSWDTRISVRPWISTQKRRMRAWKRRWTSWQGYYVECIV